MSPHNQIRTRKTNQTKQTISKYFCLCFSVDTINNFTCFNCLTKLQDMVFANTLWTGYKYIYIY